MTPGFFPRSSSETANPKRARTLISTGIFEPSPTCGAAPWVISGSWSRTEAGSSIDRPMQSIFTHHHKEEKMPESMNVRQALRELNKAEQQILTIRQALEGLSPTDPLPAAGVVIITPPTPPPYFGD